VRFLLPTFVCSPLTPHSFEGLSMSANGAFFKASAPRHKEHYSCSHT
jgi:hypothetical protein